MKTLKTLLNEKINDTIKPSKDAYKDWEIIFKSDAPTVEYLWDATSPYKIEIESIPLAEYFCSGIPNAKLEDWQGKICVAITFDTVGIFQNDPGMGFPERIGVRVGNVASYLNFCKTSDIRKIAKKFKQQDPKFKGNMNDENVNIEQRINDIIKDFFELFVKSDLVKLENAKAEFDKNIINVF